jgi:23S rRNA (pseudouridine1915-N3)-methyltransferase
VKLRVVWFGRRGADPFDREVETYRSRVDRRWAAEDIAHRPAAGGRDQDPVRALASEAEAVRRTVPLGWTLAVLDERGATRTSVEFAERLRQLEDGGVPGIAFVVGSDLGIDPDLVRSADLVVSLGAMTLPHRIARLVLWEQLFRATHILSGGRYHRQGVQ